MKRADQVQPSTEHERLLQSFDLREIDNPDPFSGFRLRYLARLRWLQNQIRIHAPSAALIVDVGCSQANLSLLMAEEGYRCVAIDLLADALKYARKKYECGTVWFVVGDGGRLPLRSEVADVVVLGEVIEHCPEPLGTLQEARRVLKPGGFLLVTTPNGDSPLVREPDYYSGHRAGENIVGPHAGHWFSFNSRSLRRVLKEAGFQQVEVALVGSLLAARRLRPLRRLLGLRVGTWLGDGPARTPLLGRFLAMTVAARAVK